MNLVSRVVDIIRKINTLALAGRMNRRRGPSSRGTLKEKRLLLASPVRILFISHDFALAGAQKVLLSIVRWIHKNAIGVEFFILELPNTSEDVLRGAFEKCCKVYTWAELSSNGHLDPDLVREHVGELDLIYCNTVVCGYKINECLKMGVPIVSHIHELEQSIQRFASTECIIKIRDNSALTIPVSPPVYENLLKRYKFPKKKLCLVYPFIEDVSSNFGKLTEVQHGFLKRINNPEFFVVFGCGTPDWRKGTDIFVHVAAHLNLLRKKKFLFVWVGDFTLELESLCRQLGVEEQVIFFGRSENPGALFQLGDLFCLSSREDPYPLVALEGAREQLPIVCFENSGGIPAFVRQHHAGVVCAYESVEEMAENILRLYNDRELRKQLGINGKSAMEKWHSADTSVPELILNSIGAAHKRQCSVSILFPITNDDKYLDRRLQNLLTQSYSDFELIILNNSSNENCNEIVSWYFNDRRIKVIANNGQYETFAQQLIRGIKVSIGKFIWFAKADNVADKNFLATMLKLMSDQKSHFAFCQTGILDAKGNCLVTSNQYSNWPNIISRLKKCLFSGVTDQEEKREFLKFIDTSGPLDSCLFKRVELDSIQIELSQYKHFGALFFFASLFLPRNQSYIQEVMNFQPLLKERSVLDYPDKELVKEIQSIKEIVANYCQR